MQIVFQLVRIQIILSVKVQRCIIFWIKHIIDIFDADLAIHDPIHRVGVHPAGRTAPNVVNMVPETVIQRTVGAESTEVPHGFPTVSVGAVFQHIIQAIMKLDRIIYFGHCRADDACLPQTDPVFEAAFDHITFSGDFGNRIVVKHTGFDRITDATPVDRRHTVACLCNCTDIDEPVMILLPLLEDRLDQVPGGTIIVLHGFFRMIISLRRNESGNMQTKVAQADTFRNVLPIQQIPVFYGQALLPFIGIEHLMVFFTVPHKDDQIVELSNIGKHGFEAFKTHSAACSSHEYRQLAHFILPSCPAPGLSLR